MCYFSLIVKYYFLGAINLKLYFFTTVDFTLSRRKSIFRDIK